MSGVLVTGATTPLGRRIVEVLASDPRVANVLAVGVDERPVALPGRVTYLRADLTRTRDVRTLLFGPARDLGITAILHTALHRSALDTGRRVHAQNVDATRALLLLAGDHPTIRRFVFRSHGEVYRVEPARTVIFPETHPLEFSPGAPQWTRDRVEADLTVCAQIALTRVSVAVLRFAEILAPAIGSQLHDYLASRVCFRPLGFDPMLNLLSLEDAAHAAALAVRAEAAGAINIPGADTLPLSKVIEKWGCLGVPLPGPFVAPLYRVRADALGLEFRYDLNFRRFHFGGVLDGTRAREVLGYVPRHPIRWPAERGHVASPRPDA